MLPQCWNDDRIALKDNNVTEDESRIDRGWRDRGSSEGWGWGYTQYTERYIQATLNSGFPNLNIKSPNFTFCKARIKELAVQVIKSSSHQH